MNSALRPRQERNKYFQDDFIFRYQKGASNILKSSMGPFYFAVLFEAPVLMAIFFFGDTTFFNDYSLKYQRTNNENHT